MVHGLHLPPWLKELIAAAPRTIEGRESRALGYAVLVAVHGDGRSDMFGSHGAVLVLPAGACKTTEPDSTLTRDARRGG